MADFFTSVGQTNTLSGETSRLSDLVLNMRKQKLQETQMGMEAQKLDLEKQNVTSQIQARNIESGMMSMKLNEARRQEEQLNKKIDIGSTLSSLPPSTTKILMDHAKSRGYLEPVEGTNATGMTNRNYLQMQEDIKNDPLLNKSLHVGAYNDSVQAIQQIQQQLADPKLKPDQKEALGVQLQSAMKHKEVAFAQIDLSEKAIEAVIKQQYPATQEKMDEPDRVGLDLFGHTSQQKPFSQAEIKKINAKIQADKILLVGEEAKVKEREKSAQAQKDIGDSVETAVKDRALLPGSQAITGKNKPLFQKELRANYPNASFDKMSRNGKKDLDPQLIRTEAFVDAVTPRLDVIEAKLKATDPSQFPTLNSLKLWIGRELGDAAPPDLNTSINSVIFEIARATGAGSQISDLKTKIEKGNLDPALNAEQFHAVVDNSRAAVLAMKHAINTKMDIRYDPTKDLRGNKMKSGFNIYGEKIEAGFDMWGDYVGMKTGSGATGKTMSLDDYLSMHTGKK